MTGGAPDLDTLGGLAGGRGVIVRLPAVAAADLSLPPTVLLPHDRVQRCALSSATLELGGAPPLALGLCLVEGRVLTLVALGPRPARGPVVVCTRDRAEPFALAVEEILATGVFPPAPGGVAWGGAEVPVLDVAALLARLEPGVWGSGPTHPRPEPRSLAP